MPTATPCSTPTSRPTQARGSGAWYVYSDGTTPPNPAETDPNVAFGIPQPPEGRFAAVTDMNAPGARILYCNVKPRVATTDRLAGGPVFGDRKHNRPTADTARPQHRDHDRQPSHSTTPRVHLLASDAHAKQASEIPAASHL